MRVLVRRVRLLNTNLRKGEIVIEQKHPIKEKKIIAKYLYDEIGDKERNNEATRRIIITMCNMYIIYAIYSVAN